MNQTPPDIESWIALSLISGLGAESFRKLLQAFGAPEQIFAAGRTALSQIVSAPVTQAICQGIDRQATASTMAWLADPLNTVITLADPDYPANLLEITDPPPLFYLKGRRELLQKPALAIVGSRNATPQGLSDAQAFAKTLSDRGLCIVSGLALGIDAAAHRGGLQGASSSIAVVGTGLDIIYPARNRELAHELAQHGALISEFPLGTPSIGANFPRRNRIISGLSKGCLVVEAALRSGSLITARLAAEQGREVFAIPGSIHSPLAKGCHALIKQGVKLVDSAQDILEDLGWGTAPADSSQAKPKHGKADQHVLDCLGFSPTTIDQVVATSGLTAEKVSAMLLKLELDGHVACLPGGFYQRIN
jgi:DNA processing protein